MNLSGGVVVAPWLWCANAAVSLLVYAAMRTQPWRWLSTSSRLHVFAGATVGCMLLWTIAGRLGGGPSFHILGTTILTLMFGPRLAFLASCIALAGWSAFGLNAVLMGAVPIASSYALYRWADRRLPNHFFVYVLASCFVNGGLAMIASRLAAMSVLWLGGIEAHAVTAADYLIASVLLAWGEALTTGMMMTIFVIYRPGWVKLFDDTRYILGR